MFSTDKIAFKRKAELTNLVVYLTFNGFMICIFASNLQIFVKIASIFIIIYFTAVRNYSAFQARESVETIQRAAWLSELTLHNLLHKIRLGRPADWQKAVLEATSEAALEIKRKRDAEESDDKLASMSTRQYYVTYGFFFIFFLLDVGICMLIGEFLASVF